MAKEVTKFFKSRVVKDPSRGFPTDAGIDFFVPEFTSKFLEDFAVKNPNIENKADRKGSYFAVPPQGRILIPSGLHSRMAEPGRALIAFNKSGVATKLGLDVGACVVDYTYQGEIHLSLINTSNEEVRVYENMKIVQFVETPVITNDIEVTEMSDTPAEDYLAFYDGMKKDRGAGGFGSTDKK